mmetsp:Transcript_11571/g.19776  ORF Transcript_11571/g.19776 Transcript_11571/m.19776 type:complete len:448 (-) Transcript_11571:52-1395(-)
MPAAAVCKLHNIALLLFLLLLFGGVALQQQIKNSLLPADQSNYNDVTTSVTSTQPNNKSSAEDEKAGECLLPLQNLSQGAFVQCRKSSPSQECLTASEFWERHCYLNMTESVRFYHLGKGGGGTILFSLVENGIVVRRDHPRPSTHGIEELLSGPVSTLLINIRDPLDRFVSAFNWRSLLFCQRDGEHRKKYPSEVDDKDRGRYQPHLRPQEFCYEKSSFQKEATIIQRLYNDDINKLAESLCEESSNFEHAVEHTKFISHAKLSMEGWLRPLLLDTNTTSIKPQGLTKFMAITFEQQSGHNSSLLEHTHEAVQQLYFDHGVDEETLDILMSRKTLRPPRVSEMMTHSSNSTAKRKVLGAVGKCCLARFLEDDYRLIQSMLGDANASNVLDPFEYVHPIIREACEWGFPIRRQLCRADLQSMLHRRAEFLDRSLGTCRDAVTLVDES